jgi:RNA 3'-phosphate cyclase
VVKKKLIEIDGGYGEGGGQILRNAVAFSVLTNKPITVTNIRKNRSNPGIKAQHYVTIKSISDIFNAEIEGFEIGSSELVFKPGKIKGGAYKFDVGTAGSITLVFQAIVLACAKSKEQITVSLCGGTDVKASPSWDYFENVYIPLIKKMGVTVFPQLLTRGYYPRGGGEAIITINPCEKIKPLKISDEEEFNQIQGKINISNLSEGIATRIKHTIVKNLLKNDFMASISVDKKTSLSPGVGATLWTESKNTILGSSMIGEKNISSEEVGQSITMNLLKEIQPFATLDAHAFDQILPFMVLAKKNGKSTCRISRLSNHASTNMWLAKQFFDVDFKIIQSEENMSIEVF